MNLSVPTVAVVDWIKKGSGACGVPVASASCLASSTTSFLQRCFVHRHRQWKPAARRLLNLQGACALIHTTSAPNFSYK